MRALIEYLEAGRRARLDEPRPPSFRGSKMNQFRRQVALESWWAHWEKRKHYDPISQERRDRLVFGRWHDFAIGVRGELANVRRVGKAQAKLRHEKARGA